MFGLNVIALELIPFDRPVVGKTEHRSQPRVFDGKPVARAAPVQRLPTNGHRHRDHALGLLIFDVVAMPGMLAVLDGAAVILGAILAIEDRSPGFNGGDAKAWLQLR